MWWRWITDDNEWEFNHLEDGHSQSDNPVVKFDSQRGWMKAKWTKDLAWLRGGVVVYYGPDELA